MPPLFTRRLIIDTEFHAPEGCRPDPICIAWRDLDSEESGSLWLYDQKIQSPPFNIDDQTLVIAHSAPAEMEVFLQMGWDLPENVIDTLAEFRVQTSGKADELGVKVSGSLLEACAFLNVPTITASEEKHRMHERCIAGGPFTDLEQQQILRYCEEDVLETARLFQALEPGIRSIDQALFRGEFQKCSGKMTHRGIPLDTELLSRFRKNWIAIQERVSADANSHYGLPLFNGKSINQEAFAEYLLSQKIAWEYSESGLLVTKDDFLKEMAKVYPQLNRIREARYILSGMQLNDLAVGPDNRNRTEFWGFSAKTGRSLPRNGKFIFGPAVWMRGLIKPEKGKALLYCDFSQEEFAIVGYLSGDPNMIKAYASGDVYLNYAIMVGALPEGATKKIYPEVREQYKNFLLSLQYGSGSKRIAVALGIIPFMAQHMLQQHRNTFRRYWEWVDEIMLSAATNQILRTSLGWEYRVVRPERIQVDKKGKVLPRGYITRKLTIQNWPAQATGSDILRIAVYMAEKAGITVLATLHDALLVECDENQVDEVSPTVLQIMGDASEVCLGAGNRVRAECDVIVKYPGRYRDKRDADTWERMMGLLLEVEREKGTDEEIH